MPTVDHAARIRQLLDEERRAHLARDASHLVSLFADDFMGIDAGRVTRPSRAESLARFQAYFDASEFLAWDDVEPPLIRISADGSMAYIVVRKLVHRIVRGGHADGQEEKATFAWMEAWERVDDRWALKAIASTVEPG